MNFAFAGAPEFAAWVLRDLVGHGRRPALVISQPDRPCGRGRRPAAPPVVAAAELLDVPCLQTEDISSHAVMERLSAEGVSTLVVAAFGQILKRQLLDSLLCLNIHASLLPAYRGAAPIERALAAGEDRTGVSIMRITEHLDEGPWALQTAVSIGLRDDAGSVGRLLALAGAIGMDQVLTAICDDTVGWTEQTGASCYAGKVSAPDCVLDTRRSAKAAHDHVRSLSPTIGARVSSGGMELKVWRTWPYGECGLDAIPAGAEGAAGSPGKLLVRNGRLFAGCAEGVIEILSIQPAGKGRMATPAFLRGYSGRLGDGLDRPAGAACAADDD